MALKAVATPSAGSLIASGLPIGIRTPSIRPVGDSITNNNDAATPGTSAGSLTTSITRRACYWSLFNWRRGNSLNHITYMNPLTHLRCGSNSGIGGNTIQDVIDRLPTLLGTMPETHMFIHIGTNSLNAGLDLATMISQYTTMIGLVIAAGKVPIVSTILPRNNVDGGGGSDWSATVTTAAQKRLILGAFNSWLEWYSRENGIICVPWHTVFGNASGDAITGYTDDGLHPSGKGSWYLAEFLDYCIGDLVPRRAVLPFNAYSLYDSTYNPQGNPVNGLFTGTGGTTTSAGGAGTITTSGSTAVVPDNIRINKSTSTTTSCDVQIVSRNDGLPGNVLQLTFTSLGTGNASENWRIEHFASASTNLTSYAIEGDLLAAYVEAEVLTGHGGTFKNVGCRVTGSNAGLSGGASQTTISFDATTKQIRASNTPFANFRAGVRIIVQGAANSANNSEFEVVSVTGNNVIQLASTATLVTEAAGNSITLTQPYMTAAASSNSSERWADEDTGILRLATPVSHQNITGNVLVRSDIYIDGTIAGTAVVRLSCLGVVKLPITPSLISFVA